MSLDILQAWAWLEMAITVCCCTGRGFCLFLAGLAGASMPLPSLATLLLFSLAVEEETALFLAAKRGIGIRGNGKVGSGSLGKVLLAWLLAPGLALLKLPTEQGFVWGPSWGPRVGGGQQRPWFCSQHTPSRGPEPRSQHRKAEPHTTKAL